MSQKPDSFETLSVTGKNPTRPVGFSGSLLGEAWKYSDQDECHFLGGRAPFDYWAEPHILPPSAIASIQTPMEKADEHFGTTPENVKIFPEISGASMENQTSGESAIIPDLSSIVADPAVMGNLSLDNLASTSAAIGILKGNRKVLLGIAGEAGSGKSFLCNYLVSEFGAVKTSFAEPLKQMLKALGLTDAQLWGNEKHIPDHKILMGRTPRHAMQSLGTEWGRHLIHPDIWALAWLKMMEIDRPTFTVIEDVRFDNEVQAIRKLGGKVIGLCRGPERRKRSWLSLSISRVHPSEDFRGLVERNGLRTIRNDGTIEDLARQVLEEVR